MKLRFPLLAAALALAATGCDDGSGPGFDVDFPFFYLQDIDTAGEPSSCCFLSASGDAVAAAGSHLYFIDHEQGYVLADIQLGQTVSAVGASAEGGYALATAGVLFYYVSDATYVVHEALVLASGGLAILTKPTSTVAWVLCDGGLVATVSTSTWNVTAYDTIAVSHPAIAAVDESGSCIFIADDADGTVKQYSTAGFGLLAQEAIPGGATDLCADPVEGAWVSCGEAAGLWHLDAGTGLHDYTVPVDQSVQTLAVSADGSYFYASSSATVSVLDASGAVQASTQSYGPASDIALSADGDRGAICAPDLYSVVMLYK